MAQEALTLMSLGPLFATRRLSSIIHHPGVGVVCCCHFEVVGQMGVDVKSSDAKGV